MIKKTIQKTPDCYPILDVRVIDGDALEATILLPFGVRHRARIRLKGWWADELEGEHSVSGHAAKHLLECFCAGRALWIFCPSERQDKYGRIIADLMEGQQIVTAPRVLGTYQLTEAEHKRRRDRLQGIVRVPRHRPGYVDSLPGRDSDGFPTGAETGPV